MHRPKPHAFPRGGSWIVYYPDRPHQWGMGDTLPDAYQNLMSRHSRRTL